MDVDNPFELWGSSPQSNIVASPIHREATSRNLHFQVRFPLISKILLKNTYPIVNLGATWYRIYPWKIRDKKHYSPNKLDI